MFVCNIELTIYFLIQYLQASQCQKEDCAIILLKHGANPNIKDSSGNSALHHAIIVGNTSITAALLAHSANTDEKTKVTIPHFVSKIFEIHIFYFGMCAVVCMCVYVSIFHFRPSIIP
jgi:hypothetical protein